MVQFKQYQEISKVLGLRGVEFLIPFKEHHLYYETI